MSWNVRPAWITEPPPIEEGWFYHAPQMANKYHRPSRLAYYRTQFGEDHRLKYLLYFVDAHGMRVLELGPQEGHHSIILEKLGVRELVSVEARPENVAKCNRIKERYHLDHTTFVQHNIEKLYNGDEPPNFSPPFDLVFCCGTLYHLPNPAKALEWMHEQAPALFLGTHYYEPASPESYPGGMFRGAMLTHKDKSFRGLALGEDTSHLGSGMSELSFWPAEGDLLQMISSAGYKTVSVLGKDLQNTRPHITILAES